MNRRGFFQKVAQAAAVVALAPQLAFRPEKLTPPPLDLEAMQREFYALVKARRAAGHADCLFLVGSRQEMHLLLRYVYGQWPRQEFERRLAETVRGPNGFTFGDFPTGSPAGEKERW